MKTMWSRQSATALVVISLFITVAYGQLHTKSDVGQKEKLETQQPENLSPEPIGICSITDLEIKNPEIALKYGIEGYIKIKLANKTRDLILREGETNITLLIRFVSHSPNLTETVINLDPEDEDGPVAGRYLQSGELIKLNDYVSYQPNGQITLKAGQLLNVTMTIRITDDFPIISVPVRAVGITADVPIIDNLNVDVRKQS